MLVFFILTFAVEISLASSLGDTPKFKTISRYVAAVATLGACFTVLLMPFRKHSLPIFDISSVGQAPSSDFRSPEDNLRLWQFLTVSWMAPLISLGRRRQLNEPDVWLLGYEFQHRRLHEKFRRIRGAVLARLLKANGLDILIISAIATVQMFCEFSTPVLLQQLLQAMQDPSKPKRVPLTYALLSLVLRLVAAQSQVLNLWYGRRCYERSRGEMVMMVYGKALSRKNILGARKVEDVSPLTEEEATNGDEARQGLEEHPVKVGFWSRLFPRRRKAKQIKSKEAASLGKIFNLLRGDVYDVAQRFWEVDVLIDKPLGLIIAVWLVWTLFGPSCFLGIFAVLIAQGLNAFVTRILLRWEEKRRAATDSRLQITSQFVEAIRHLRWYGWQGHWLRQVMEARQHELNLRIVTSLWSILIRFINAFASGVFPVIALYAYTMLAGRELRIDIIFPALQLFTMLESRLRDIPGLITAFINASIALGRIEDFMEEPDKDQLPLDDPTEEMPFKLESCSFAWPGKTIPVLTDINVTIPKGITVVSGKVGAGKTAFLQALLGELDRLDGSYHIPNEMVGYCAQTPWLQSMSIRDNILFSAPYDEQRYKRTLDACALLPDLSQFKHGDLTFVGENGIGLSGGQKARVALARAVYSASRVLLLDDPLSALDHNTAEFIVRKCLSGPLMQGRTIVLVTHRTSLVRSIASQVIEFDEGHGKLHDRNSIVSSTKYAMESSMLSTDSETETEGEVSLQDQATAVPDKFIEEEHRAEWGVKARVYGTYIKAGKYRWWLALVLVLTVYRLASVGQSWFLKGWGEAYNTSTSAFNGLSRDTTWLATSSVDAYFAPPNPMDQLPPPRDDARPWLWTFFAIISFQAAALLIAQFLMLAIVYFAGKTLFKKVMARVSHATFRFFDVTPVGRLMNRLTSDIGVVDGNISEQFQVIAFQAITWISSILVIATATPTFLILSLILTVAFVLIFLRFLPTSQSLRRLEMVSLTPLLSNFGELLHGLTTVRAFRAEERFQSRVISVVDKFQGMDHFYWSLQAWLMYRFESLSAFSTFCLTALALYTNTTPGLVAFVLIAANNFVESTHALCKQYGQLQMDFVSVERVDELLHIEEESPGTVEPPAAWPTYGSDITFEDVTLRYAPQLDPSLKDVSLRIHGGSTTAIIGRTGSGKSTLAVSLLSVIRPEIGRITIDNIDIAEVSTQALRTRVTFVAQDPVLFPGSIRLNLDPTGDFSDRQCGDVLERLCSRHGWHLETHIEAGGKNLSQGQRQLIALTRAVLRRSPVVILDEATASIDHETSLDIQQIVREELQLSTVITIAHRIEAVKDAEYYVVLDQGRVSRQGHVRDLQAL
jgi:ABC-type multidrug transport system fused ATPase/permease subunit